MRADTLTRVAATAAGAATAEEAIEAAAEEREGREDWTSGGVDFAVDARLRG